MVCLDTFFTDPKLAFHEHVGILSDFGMHLEVHLLVHFKVHLKARFAVFEIAFSLSKVWAKMAQILTKKREKFLAILCLTFQKQNRASNDKPWAETSESEDTSNRKQSETIIQSK